MVMRYMLRLYVIMQRQSVIQVCYYVILFKHHSQRERGVIELWRLTDLYFITSQQNQQGVDWHELKLKQLGN